MPTKKCYTCRNYIYSYGHKNGRFVGSHKRCDYAEAKEKECKENNLSKWEPKRRNDV